MKAFVGLMKLATTVVTFALVVMLVIAILPIAAGGISPGETTDMTATVEGWNLSSTCLRVSTSWSDAPKMRSLSLMAEVTTLMSASSSGRDAMKLHPAGPCTTMTSTSMSRRVYIAATIGLGRGCMTVLTGRPP